MESYEQMMISLRAVNFRKSSLSLFFVVKVHIAVLHRMMEMDLNEVPISKKHSPSHIFEMYFVTHLAESL